MRIQKDNSPINIHFIRNIFLKKLAHAYFGRRIFSKSFGGKIRHIWTDVAYRINKEKWRVRIYCIAPIFFWRDNFSSQTALHMIEATKISKQQLFSLRIFAFESNLSESIVFSKNCATSVLNPLNKSCLSLVLHIVFLV